MYTKELKYYGGIFILFIGVCLFIENRQDAKTKAEYENAYSSDEVVTNEASVYKSTGHTCYECGRDCKADTEMFSKGDISTNYVSYHLCGREECLDNHLKRIQQAQLNSEPYRGY